MRNILQIALTDFRNTYRSNNFLLVLALAIYAAYTFVPGPQAQYLTIGLDNFRGLYNEAWIAMAVSMMAGVFLTLFGFFLINNSIGEDARLHINHLISSSVISNRHYVFGKFIGNLSVLLTLQLLLMGVGFCLFIYWKEVEGFSFIRFVFPFLMNSLPQLVFVSALAIFLESLGNIPSWVKNLAFVFLFLVFLAIGGLGAESWVVWLDLFGSAHAFEAMEESLLKQGFDYQGSRHVGYLILDNENGPSTFLFDFLPIKGVHIVQRLFWIIFGLILVEVGSRTFTRFSADRTKTIDARDENKRGGLWRKLDLTFLNRGKLAILLAEWKILFMVYKKSWWLVTFLMFVLLAFVPLKDAHLWVLPTLWLFQLHALSNMGHKHKSMRMEELVLATVSSRNRLLTAELIGATGWLLILSFPLLVRAFILEDFELLVSVFVAGFLLTSLAQFLGLLTKGGKLFQIVFGLSWYLLINKFEYVDIYGALQDSVYWITLPITFILMAGILVLNKIELSGGQKFKIRS